MESLALHNFHLDDGEEVDRVIQFLEPSGIWSKWPIERPTKETNAIFIPVKIPDAGLEEWEVREQKLEKSLDLLRALDKRSIDAIKALSLSVAMRVHTIEFYLQLPDGFVSECGRLGLEICIFNLKAFDADRD